MSRLTLLKYKSMRSYQLVDLIKACKKLLADGRLDSVQSQAVHSTLLVLRDILIERQKC